MEFGEKMKEKQSEPLKVETDKISRMPRCTQEAIK